MGNEIGAAVAVELGTNLYVSVHDQRGSVAVLLTPAGTVAESYRYDAYGNVKIYDQTGSEIANHQSAIGNLWQFSSKRMDKETGLYCFGRRCYDPTLGRFVTADPSGFADGPNLYAYCGGDPVNLIDPDGQLSKSYSSGSSISLPSNYGSSSWGFNQNSFAGVDQIKQDYHNYQMQNNATYYDQHTYAQSSVNYSPSTVLYASSSYSYAPSTFSYANPSTSSYQAFDKSRIAASQGNYL
ncbi:MAG: RHS repeat-associated core domain-containing protein, partial [Kiritimatiellales bacterium]